MIPSWTAQKNDCKNDIKSINQLNQQSIDQLNQPIDQTNNRPIETNRSSDGKQRLGKAGRLWQKPKPIEKWLIERLQSPPILQMVLDEV